MGNKTLFSTNENFKKIRKKWKQSNIMNTAFSQLNEDIKLETSESRKSFSGLNKRMMKD